MGHRTVQREAGIKDRLEIVDMNNRLNSFLNVKWVDPEEGDFSAAATVNVVKNSKNPELAQLFVNYLISDKICDG